MKTQKNNQPINKGRSAESTKGTSSIVENNLMTRKFIISPNNNKKNGAKSSNIDKQKMLNHLFDLQKTLDINFEILKTFCNNNDTMLIEEISKLNEIYKKKSDLISQMKEKKSKILIESQIFYDVKREFDENTENYRDSIIEAQDNVNNKEEYVKLFQKKFVEVEVYLNRITADMADTERKEYYQNYKMADFTDLNNLLLNKKNKLTKQIEKFSNDIEKIEKDNQKLIEEEDQEKIQKKESKNSEDMLNNEVKKKQLDKKINQLENKVKKITFKRDKLQNFFKNHFYKNDKSENLNIENNNEKIQKEPVFKKVSVKTKKINSRDVIKERDEENDRSLLPEEMAKRMNSFMDFSIVLNKGEQKNVNNFGNFYQGNISKINPWDISAIGPKEN